MSNEFKIDPELEALLDDNEPLISSPLTPTQEVKQDGLLLMKHISEDTITESHINGDKLLNKTKLFIIAQACNELNRVIKMTKLLDTLEDKFIDAINNKLDESPNNIQLLTFAMETITTSLNRSNNLIVQVLKDEKLSQVIINTTNIITADGSSATIMDMNSRDAIRNMASCLLAELGHAKDDTLEGTEQDNNE